MRNFGYFEEGKIGRISDIRIWQRLFTYCRVHKTGLAAAILLSMLVTGTTLTLPRLMQMAIDNSMTATGIDIASRMGGLGELALMYGFAVAITFVAGFMQVVLLEYIGQSIMNRLRNDLYRHLLCLDLAFFHSHPAGRLVTRLTNDIQNMHEMFTSVMVTLFNDALKLIGILVVLYLLNVRLAMVMTVFLPLSLIVTLLFSRLARDRFRAIRSQLAVLNAFLQETVSAVNILQLFGRQQESLSRFKELNREYLQRTLRQIRLFGTFMPLTEFLSSLAMATILWYGGGEIIREQLTLGELVAFFSYMRLFFQPMRELSQKYSIVQSAMASAERIFQLLDTRSSINAPSRPLSGELIKGEIRFEKVSFRYQDEKEEVLHAIDLQIKAGETVALVGSTGAGKSTLISLFVRFYDPTGGKILIDGHDLREFAPETLREKIGIVLQDVLIEPDTVLANIALGTGRDRQAVQEILEQTGMDSFIERLPDGLDTRIGEGGLDLSAGEKQLLAFARVLCRNPIVLILDEATASVDTEAENLLEQAIRASFSGRTSVVIAHRLSTVRRADRIVVMDRGRIVEQGSHEELM
ncbi:MAG: ABC transporter ATP-binding protein, partial [Thermodesulfobacteriota bacterium]|nr:ABC transporter ATP-binding protein [Thermodesulfobacteriota bacterium]